MGISRGSIISNVTYVVVELRSCCGGPATLFTFPNTPIHFVTNGVYNYTGTGNFPNTDGTLLEPGKCYTAIVQPELVPGDYPAGPPVAEMPMIDSGCDNKICIDACAQPSCGCPDGYVVGSDGRCQKTSYTQPTCFPTTYTIDKGTVVCYGPEAAYGLVGAVFYNDITLLPWPIIATSGTFVTPTTLLDATSVPVPVVNTIQNSVWGTSTGYSAIDCPNYRLNKVGVWTPLPGPGPTDWLGFTYCLNILETKTYYIGIASDDNYRLLINGNMVIDANGAGYCFSSWKIIPITLTAGNNVIEARNLNSGGGPGTLGFEVYDATLAQLQAVTTATGANGVPNPGNPTDLCQYILFTTESLIGQTWQTGVISGCNCPAGYSLFTCNGENQCIQVLYAEATTCNIKLTPCCGTGDPVIIAGGTIPLSHVGETVCIPNIDPVVGCWTISTTDEPVDYTGPVTPGNYTATCEECVSLGCKTCPDSYFTFTDCCTGEPLTYTPVGTTTPLTMVFNWTGLYIDDITPASIGTEVCITDLGIKEGDTFPGCWKLTEIPKPTTPDPTQYVLDWNNIITVTTIPSTECPDCRICYLLENCLDETDTLVTGTDLSAYVGQVITIEGCKNKCYIVSLAENCDNCSQPVSVINSYQPGASTTSVCTYILGTEPFSSLTITIDGTVYDFSDPATFITEANALNLGLFGQGTSDGELIVTVTGTHVYTELCLDLISGSILCLEPVCTIVNKLCEYTITKIDGTSNASVTINGTTYTTPSPIDLTSIGELTDFLNSLGLGVWTAIPGSPDYQLSVSGNNDYGTIDFIRSTFDPTCQEFVDPATACDACLPKPAPAVQPLLLNTRPVKPGYRTPGCSPEYTEKVNSNFSDQVYAQMLSVRYGLTTCCQEDLDYWVIKKQLLDFKAINDNNLTDNNNV